MAMGAGFIVGTAEKVLDTYVMLPTIVFGFRINVIAEAREACTLLSAMLVPQKLTAVS